ncbi:MAG: hypothetical protein ABIQ16_04140 [Polyangiaceae bacterium]
MLRHGWVFEAVSAICSDPIAVPSQISRVPAGFDAWFARAVCRDREQRFQTAFQLADALKAVLETPRKGLGVENTVHSQRAESYTGAHSRPRDSSRGSAR